MAQEQKNMAGLIQIPYNLRELFTFQDGRRQTEILKKNENISNGFENTIQHKE